LYETLLLFNKNQSYKVLLATTTNVAAMTIENSTGSVITIRYS